jgi:hypothetical protein
MDATESGTGDVWRERIIAQQVSGQSIRAWCRDNQHHEHAFYWWRSRMGLSPVKTGKSPTRSAKPPMTFAEIVVDRPAGESICFRLGGNRELILPLSMEVENIARLVRAIEASA